MSTEVSAPFSLYGLRQNNVKVGKVVWLKLHRKPFILDSKETKAVALYFSGQRSWILVSERVKESLWQLTRILIFCFYAYAIVYISVCHV